MYCKECGKEVIVKEDKTIERTCEHEDAPIVAECAANLKGKGTLK